MKYNYVPTDAGSFTIFEDGQAPIASFVEEATAKLFCNAHHLLLRAHDIMCGEHNSETLADFSDLRNDIRSALQLPVTDCNCCHECIPEVEATERNGLTLCLGCLELHAQFSS